MGVELFLNNERLDVDLSTKVSETKQVNDFFEISDRQTSYTNSFKLPKTERNKRLFGGHGIPGTTALAPYRLHRISVYRDGLPTVVNGLAYIKSVTDYYNVHIYSDNIDLFDTIGDKKLADLNLSAYSHTLTANQWINSFQHENGYIYAMADYGKVDTNAIEWNYTVPSVFIRTLWNKIFEEAGFTYAYTGRVGAAVNLFNPFITDEWKELAITLDEGFDNNLDGASELQLEMSKSGYVEVEEAIINNNGQNITINELDGFVTEYLRFSNIIADPHNLHQISNTQQYQRSRIKIQNNGFYKIDVTGYFQNLQTEGISVYIERNGINLLTIEEGFTDDEGNFGGNHRIYLNQNDELLIKVVSIASENKVFYTYDINCKLYTDNVDIAVNLNSYFSSISQKEFLKDVMRHFGLICRRNGTSYEFMAIEELLTPNIAYNGFDLPAEDIYVDWSKKYNNTTQLDTVIGRYTKRNLLQYQYEDSNNNFADSVITVDDHTLDDEAVLLQRIYAAPENSTTFLNNNLLKYCPVYQKVLNDDGSLKEIKKRKTKPYLVRILKSNTTINYKESGADYVYQYTGMIPFVTFEGLDWASIVPNRYAAFTNMLNYGKKYTVNVLLNIIDVHRLDFFKLIYIKQLGGLFYLNKISNFSGSTITKAELIQVRSIERLGQFADDCNNDFLI